MNRSNSAPNITHNVQKDFTMSIENTRFEALFNDATDMTFDPQWANGTGYFDHATKALVEPGKVARSVDENGRKIVLFGTEIGALVVFERYSSPESRIVYNAPRGWGIVHPLSMSSGTLDEEMLSTLSIHPQHVIQAQKKFWASRS
jgi:hypothetical protein